ncbi:MAG: hypothetical protein E7454_07235 [Ruminococcaceae bacterium]|nr:hypothetical protein [Oscillospiraceae bacterium]
MKAAKGQYDITLLLFSKCGSRLKDIPEDVKIITPGKAYCMLGLTKQELKKHPVLFFLKACLMQYTKLFSRRSAMKLLGIFQKKFSGCEPDNRLQMTQLSKLLAE